MLLPFLRIPALSASSAVKLLRLPYKRSIAFRPAVSEELPDISHFGDHVEVEVGDHQFVFVAAGLGDDLAAGIAEVTLAVELADVPGGFGAHAVQCADEVSVGDGVRGLFEFPQVF